MTPCAAAKAERVALAHRAGVLAQEHRLIRRQQAGHLGVRRAEAAAVRPNAAATPPRVTGSGPVPGGEDGARPQQAARGGVGGGQVARGRAVRGGDRAERVVRGGRDLAAVRQHDRGAGAERVRVGVRLAQFGGGDRDRRPGYPRPRRGPAAGRRSRRREPGGSRVDRGGHLAQGQARRRCRPGCRPRPPGSPGLSPCRAPAVRSPGRSRWPAGYGPGPPRPRCWPACRRPRRSATVPRASKVPGCRASAGVAGGQPGRVGRDRRALGDPGQGVVRDRGIAPLHRDRRALVGAGWRRRSSARGAGWPGPVRPC